MLGKNADASGPLGPIVTTDEVPGIEAGLHLVTRVNGEIVQDTSTADMIFTPAEVASYLSRTFTLLPGDTICTGTPSGVGHWVSADAPPFLIGHGDRDRIVPAAQSRTLHEALVRAGARSSLLLLGGAGHEDAAFDAPANLALTAGFLSAVLRNP